mmetsp:Transcript_3389/g.8380  ORF Transcript_3389/g.8380 Transcript_3389/m.8380 type:complete len:204 (+) Transcript_3389:45-656(+)
MQERPDFAFTVLCRAMNLHLRCHAVRWTLIIYYSTYHVLRLTCHQMCHTCAVRWTCHLLCHTCAIYCIMLCDVSARNVTFLLLRSHLAEGAGDRVLRERPEEEQHLPRVLDVESRARWLATDRYVERAARGRSALGLTRPAAQRGQGGARAGDGGGEHVLVRVVVAAAEHEVSLSVVRLAEDGVHRESLVYGADAHLYSSLGE